MVMDERVARRRYPGVAWTHPQMYPGKMVPVWAIELLKVFEHAGLTEFGQAVNRVVKRVKDTDVLHELVQGLGTLVILGLEAQALPSTIAARSTRMIESYFEEHGLKPLDPADLLWHPKSR